MTTVLGLARDGLVWMAADSQVSLCERPMPGAVRKILRVPVGGRDSGNEVLIGVAGDGAIAGLARRFLKIESLPGPDEDDVQDFVDQIAQGLSELARDHGILDEGRMAAMLLLGWNGRLWTLVHSQAIPHHDGIAGVGSGSDAGLGALDALLRQQGIDPVAAIVEAVEIAIGRDLNSAGPVYAEGLHAPVPPVAVVDEKSAEESRGE